MRILMDLDKKYGDDDDGIIIIILTSLLSGGATEQSDPTPPFHMLRSFE